MRYRVAELFCYYLLVNRSILSDHVLRLIWRWGLLLSFCLGRDSGCEDVLSAIALVDKIFKVLTEGSILRSLSFDVMEEVVVLHSGTSRC